MLRKSKTCSLPEIPTCHTRFRKKALVGCSISLQPTMRVLTIRLLLYLYCQVRKQIFQTWVHQNNGCDWLVVCLVPISEITNVCPNQNNLFSASCYPLPASVLCSITFPFTGECWSQYTSCSHTCLCEGSVKVSVMIYCLHFRLRQSKSTYELLINDSVVHVRLIYN